VRGEPEQAVQHREQRHQPEEGERERDLDPIRRVDNERVPLAVAGRERERDRKRKDHEQGEEPAHRS
jgi:hypothetical protein